jgi:putative ABC transport system ATP-binding protein
VLIEVSDLVKSYRDRRGATVPVLTGLSLGLGRGEYVAVTGKSGSGKSTLLSILGCLDRPDGGTYRLDDQEVGSLPERQRADLRNRRIGFVFQSFHLLPFLTVQDNVALPGLYARSGQAVAGGRIQELLDQMGLAGKGTRYPGELSGGEQQRVAIARALVLGADLVLADEPTGNLDAATAQEVLAVLEKLLELGKTLVLVTHDPGVAARARRQIRLENGKVHTENPVEKVGQP